MRSRVAQITGASPGGTAGRQAGSVDGKHAIAILLPPQALRVPVTVLAVLIALAIAGAISAHIGGSSARPAILRVVLGGAAGLALTYTIGHLFGTALG